jgi:hypothetical protein
MDDLIGLHLRTLAPVDFIRPHTPTPMGDMMGAALKASSLSDAQTPSGRERSS